MTKEQKIMEAVLMAKRVYEFGEELGVWGELRVWWRSRPPVLRRRARRQKRREEALGD